MMRMMIGEKFSASKLSFTLQTKKLLLSFSLKPNAEFKIAFQQKVLSIFKAAAVLQNNLNDSILLLITTQGMTQRALYLYRSR